MRQEQIDAAAEGVLAEDGVTLDSITAYQVAKRAAISPGPAIYQKFNDWKQRKLAERDKTDFRAPTEMFKGAEDAFDHFKATLMAFVMNMVNNIGGQLEAAAQLRFERAEQALREKERQWEEILDQWTITDQELRNCERERNALKGALAASRDRESELKGRLAQMAEDRNAAVPSKPVTKVDEAFEGPEEEPKLPI